MYNQNQAAGGAAPGDSIVGCALGALYDLSVTQGNAVRHDSSAVITTPAGTIPADPIAYILMLAGSGGSANLEALSRNARNKAPAPEEILDFIWNSPYVQQAR
jgi:hypothetical protein